MKSAVPSTVSILGREVSVAFSPVLEPGQFLFAKDTIQLSEEDQGSDLEAALLRAVLFVVDIDQALGLSSAAVRILARAVASAGFRLHT